MDSEIFEAVKAEFLEALTASGVPEKLFNISFEEVLNDDDEIYSFHLNVRVLSIKTDEGPTKPVDCYFEITYHRGIGEALITNEHNEYAIDAANVWTQLFFSQVDIDD